MEVKIKANIEEGYYDAYYTLNVKYTYKIVGKRGKEHSRFKIISQIVGEPNEKYRKRLIETLRSLTKEEVIEMIKGHVTKVIESNMKYATEEQEKEELLRSLNNIKFTFTIK